LVFREACRAEGRSTRGVSALAAGLVAAIEGFYSVGAGAPGVIPPGSAAGIARRMAAG